MVHIWEEREGNRDCYNLYEDLLNQSLRVEWTCGKVPGSFFASEIFRHFAEILDAWVLLHKYWLRFIFFLTRKKSSDILLSLFRAFTPCSLCHKIGFLQN
jgi:hypothetical protein